jgi:hypothetical protein
MAGALGVLSGCPTEVGSGAAPAAMPAPAQPTPAAPAGEPVIPPPPEEQGPRGSVRDDVPYPLAALLGRPRAEVEAKLGAKRDKDTGGRSTCVRFVPERTWFRCESRWQRYDDLAPSRFGAVMVTYEDGVVAAFTLDGLPGEGAFDHQRALALAGLELPGEPRVRKPQNPLDPSRSADVTVWSYFNDAARLEVGGRQYRVEVSVVEGQWARAKVDVILNDRLNDDERARIVPAGDAP